jgi:hypothetical protein
MYRTMRRAAAAASIAVVVILASPAAAFAHEQRQVGVYQFTVGWAHEPTYTGVENAVQVFVKDAKGKAVDDLGDPATLKLTVVTGTQTSDPLELKPSFDADTGLGTHGEFDAAIVPTAAGAYTFHLTGTVNDQKVDEKFTSSDKTFDTVKEPTDVEFPAKIPSASELAANLTRLTPRVDTAAARAKTGAMAASSARKKATEAMTIAIIALVVGVALGGGGLLAGTRARRGHASPAGEGE